MLTSHRHRAFVLLAFPLSFAVACSSFSEAENPGPDDGGVDGAVDGGPSREAEPPSDQGSTDASSDAGPVAYSKVFHFDNAADCADWQRLHGATFTSVVPGEAGGGACQLCQDPASVDPTVSPFVSFSLDPHPGTYRFEAFFKQDTPYTRMGSLRFGLRASTNGGLSLKNSTAVAAVGSVFGPDKNTLSLSSSDLPDSEPYAVSATIEIDPADAALGSDECWDVDEVTLTFTP